LQKKRKTTKDVNGNSIGFQFYSDWGIITHLKLFTLLYPKISRWLWTLDTYKEHTKKTIIIAKLLC